MRPPEMGYSDFPNGRKTEFTRGLARTNRISYRNQHEQEYPTRERSMYGRNEAYRERHYPQHEVAADRRSSQYRSTHPSNLQADSNRRQSKRTQSRRKVRRSRELQSVIDRLQRRREAEHPERYHQVGFDDFVGISEPYRDDSDEVQQTALDMISSYDMVLDHLLRKNQDLKACVAQQSDQLPSNRSFTSSEVVDTLEFLRENRERITNASSKQRSASAPRFLRTPQNTKLKAMETDMPFTTMPRDREYQLSNGNEQRQMEDVRRESRVRSRLVHEQHPADEWKSARYAVEEQRKGDRIAQIRQQVDNTESLRYTGQLPIASSYKDEYAQERDDFDDIPRYNQQEENDFSRLRNNDIQRHDVPNRERRTFEHSARLSQLLPPVQSPELEIPARDRLNRFRESRTRASLKYELEQTPLSTTRARSPEPSRYKHRRPCNLRPGNPERPYDIHDCDRYGRSVDEIQEPRWAAAIPPSRPSESNKSTRVMDTRPLTRTISHDGPRESPTDQARDLIEDFNHMYAFAREVTASNEEMEQNLNKMKQISKDRRNFFLKNSTPQPLDRSQRPITKHETNNMKHERGLDTLEKFRMRGSIDNSKAYEYKPVTRNAPPRMGENPLASPEHVTEEEIVQYKVREGPKGRFVYRAVTDEKKLDPTYPVLDKVKTATKSKKNRNIRRPSRPPEKEQKKSSKKKKKPENIVVDFPDLLAVCSNEKYDKSHDKYTLLSTNESCQHRSSGMNFGKIQTELAEEGNGKEEKTNEAIPIQDSRHHFHDTETETDDEPLHVTKARTEFYTKPILDDRATPGMGCGCAAV